MSYDGKPRYWSKPTGEYRTKRDGNTILFQQKYLVNYWITVSPSWTEWRTEKAETCE